ncbi:hypothetical protein TW95_gp1726 [Pandoravirus inopinatum]|uniref:Uncharacterized protein n=1 Tax=Pandoravirus inopinatum TaxID=1605721 RepID=A0A0B5J914_9VIRU|nr:hypothetical protein TW95_gp1726 [Pandoravirus inopinatum]AJF98460.1 hypothetical protein [Pandoravirus inopinatum]
MKRLIASPTRDAPSYELVDMPRAGNSDNVDDSDDDPRHQTDPLTGDPVDGNDPETGSMIETTDRGQALSVLTRDLFVSVAHAGFWVLVAIAAMAVVFWLFYLGFVRPPLAAVNRLVPSKCNITSHLLISTMTADDGTGNQYIPGLGVRFVVEHGGDLDASTQEAIARPRLRRGESWMDARGRDAYFARFPVGTVAQCYYSREEHDFVAMSDESDALRHALMWGVALAIMASVILFCCCCSLVGFEMEQRRRLRARSLDAMAARA